MWMNRQMSTYTIHQLWLRPHKYIYERKTHISYHIGEIYFIQYFSADQQIIYSKVTVEGWDLKVIDKQLKVIDNTWRLLTLNVIDKTWTSLIHIWKSFKALEGHWNHLKVIGNLGGLLTVYLCPLWVSILDEHCSNDSPVWGASLTPFPWRPSSELWYQGCHLYLGSAFFLISVSVHSYRRQAWVWADRWSALASVHSVPILWISPL